MWFDDEDVTGRRLPRKKKKNRRRSVLKVSARSKTKPTEVPRRIILFFLILICLVGVSALVYYGVKLTGESLFSQNDRFRIKTLDIKTQDGAVLTPALIQEYTQISEGVNLFEIDIRKIRKDFLARVPNIKSIEITRFLPDTLRIEVVERVPLARIKQRRASHVYVDEQGYVFAARSQNTALPSILGYRGPVLKPGVRVGGILRDAVVVLDTSRKIPLADNIQVRGVNVAGGYEGKSDAVRLYLSGKTHVDLWWIRRRQKHMVGSIDLKERLQSLGATLRKAKREALDLRSINLTLDSYKEKVTVTPR